MWRRQCLLSRMSGMLTLIITVRSQILKAIVFFRPKSPSWTFSTLNLCSSQILPHDKRFFRLCVYKCAVPLTLFYLVLFIRNKFILGLRTSFMNCLGIVVGVATVIITVTFVIIFSDFICHLGTVS